MIDARSIAFAALVASAAFAVLPSPLLAQSTAPSFDCVKASSPVEKLICGDKSFAALDRETTRLYALARDNAGTARDDLVKFQRTWIIARDECAASTDKERCLAESYVGRINALRQQFAAARQPKGGISLGPFSAQCDRGDPLTVTFVNSNPAYVYIGTAKDSFVLKQVLSGSGARYEAQYPKGQSRLWNKGDNATIALPGGRDMNCTLKPVAQTPN